MSPIPAYSQSMIQIRASLEDEVRGQQVVVARPGGAAAPHALDPPGDVGRAFVDGRNANLGGPSRWRRTS